MSTLVNFRGALSQQHRTFSTLISSGKDSGNFVIPIEPAATPVRRLCSRLPLLKHLRGVNVGREVRRWDDNEDPCAKIPDGRCLHEYRRIFCRLKGARVFALEALLDQNSSFDAFTPVIFHFQNFVAWFPVSLALARWLLLSDALNFTLWSLRSDALALIALFDLFSTSRYLKIHWLSQGEGSTLSLIPENGHILYFVSTSLPGICRVHEVLFDKRL